MLFRRLAAVALGLVLSIGVTFAQENPREVSPDPIPNWAAPPFWSPLRAEELSKSREPGAEPLAVEALPTPSLPFIGITPCRIVDTRGPAGPFGGPALVANVTRTFNLPAGPCVGLPSDAGAWSLNVTIIGTSNLQGGFLTAWPTGIAQPTVSTLNFNATELSANAAVVPAGTGGAINIFVNIPGHLLIDINGYYRNVGVVTTVNGLSGAVTLAAGSNVSITPSGNTLTIASTGGGAGSAWSLTGNSGTSAGTNFLGTTDNQALELKVNGNRALRLEPNATSPNVIGGSSGNVVTSGKSGAAIGGGTSNAVTESLGAISGGDGNQAGLAAAVAGGSGNVASGFYSAIPGGGGNSATAPYSFAAGFQAHALHASTFVWSDGPGGPQGGGTSSTRTQQFLVRANGGAVFLRTPEPPHATAAALQVEHSDATGEAAWLYGTNTSSSVQSAVLRLLKHPSATSKNFLECTDFDGSNPPVANKCHIAANGAFTAGSDFAEALPARGGKSRFEPGDVLVASREVPGAVEKSSRRSDTRAIGVYSTRPGFVGADKNGETRVDAEDIPVAITGIVPTKVDEENGPIEPGDLLTTADLAGYAMKASPVTVAGVEIYAPGTIIGKAIEPLRTETGVIKVLVMLR
jgi:hypothetical protein